ncbi:hypothetical protein M2S00_05305 [Apilactobacillus sp. TMW 2.2459]|uniref:hypothetical protein n=1 Tax=Apilactobacillus xinyiensis TaxID=2841032 RepID=UPI00200C3152|nr:hypothetical protein [Apilactobacillus xinyiensis]MCL0312522.1 hypothetical protein [Apilactobacillus xinyiensis]
MKKIRIIFKLIIYMLVSYMCLVMILMYLGRLQIKPLKYNFQIIDLYFIFNAGFWAVMKCFDAKLIKLKKKRIITYKERALKMNQMDKNNNASSGKWSTRGMNYNPWAYNSSSTVTYSNVSGCGYNIFISILLNILFILLSPIFLIGLLIKK